MEQFKDLKNYNLFPCIKIKLILIILNFVSFLLQQLVKRTSESGGLLERRGHDKGPAPPPPVSAPTSPPSAATSPTLTPTPTPTATPTPAPPLPAAPTPPLTPSTASPPTTPLQEIQEPFPKSNGSVPQAEDEEDDEEEEEEAEDEHTADFEDESSSTEIIIAGQFFIFIFTLILKGINQSSFS